ncbi:hypothetical protein ACWEQL_28880 [Kitasatospora sp. NPDC004240]
MSDIDPVLPAPVVDGGGADDAGQQVYVTVTVPGYAEFAAGDKVQLFWGGVASDSHVVPEGEDDKPIPFTIPWETVLSKPEEPITVTYTVTRGAGTESAPSAGVDLTAVEKE